LKKKIDAYVAFDKIKSSEGRWMPLRELRRNIMEKNIKPLSLRQTSISIMKANPEMDMKSVCELISASTGMDFKKSQAYYRWIVKEGMAPGFVPGSKSTPKIPQPKKSEEAPEKSEVPAPRRDEPIIESWAHRYIRKGYRKGVRAGKSASPKSLSEIVNKGIQAGDVRVHKIPTGKGGTVKDKKGKAA
jgi:hypothetical protein